MHIMDEIKLNNNNNHHHHSISIFNFYLFFSREFHMEFSIRLDLLETSNINSFFGTANNF